MLYLLRSYGIHGKSILKVGFTDSPEKRFETYFYHNPEVEIISVREGDEVLENFLHLYLGSLGLQYKKKGRLSEWFVDSPEIYQLFHLSRKSLEKRVWKGRNKIFDRSKIISSYNSNSWNPSYNLFEVLYRKNKKTFNGNTGCDVDRAFWSVYLKKNPHIMDELLGFL